MAQQKKLAQKEFDEQNRLKIAADVSGAIGSLMDIAVMSQQKKLVQKKFDEQMTGLSKPSV